MATGGPTNAAQKAEILAAQRNVIGGLINATNSQAIKKVLMIYNPAEEVKYKTNQINIAQSTAPELEECAQYLGFGDLRIAGKKQYKNKKILSDRIILRIESLFCTKCDDCDQDYTNKLAEAPYFTCKLCMQGSHDCEKVKEKHDVIKKLQEEDQLLLRFGWLCHGCLLKNDLSLTSNIEVEASPDQPDEEEPEEEDEKKDRVSPRRNRHAQTEEP